MNGRSVGEWIGATPDAKVPASVRVRVFDRDGGICHVSSRKIMTGEPWDLDHMVALCNGGEHRESNLAPVLREKHPQKTRTDLAKKSKVTRLRQKHLGIHASVTPIPGGRSTRWRRTLSGRTVKR